MYTGETESNQHEQDEEEDDEGNDDLDGPNDEELTQRDYSEAIGNSAPDTIYSKFLRRVQRGGANQVLRYSRWSGTPLAVGRAGSINESDIPQCGYCGAPRRFEFQILPQLLHYLHVDCSTNLVDISTSTAAADGLPDENIFSNGSGKVHFTI
jgi:pre-rRNA-processing protein TSR4